MVRSNPEFPSEPVAGEWWLPGNRTEARAGELTYGPRKEPRLSLIFGWADERVQLGAAIARGVIHGQTTRLDAMTLLDSTDKQGKVRWGSPGSGYSRNIVGDLLVFGAHTGALDAIEIRQLILQHTSAPLVVQQNGIESTVRPENYPHGAWYDPKVIEVTPRTAVVDGVQIQVVQDRRVSRKTTTSSGVELVIRSTPTFSLTPSEATEDRDFRSLRATLMEPLDALVRFAADRDGGWHHVAIRDSIHDGESQPLRIHYRDLVDAAEFEWPAYHKPIFHLDSDDFGALVESWVDLCRSYGESIGAGLDGCFARWNHERIRLLALALEGLSDIAGDHARRFDETERELIKSTLSGCAGISGEARAAALSEVSRVTLQARLESLVRHLEAAGAPVPLEVIAQVGNIKKFRNQFSHPQPGSSADGASLLQAIAAAQGLFRAVVLSELKIEQRTHLMNKVLQESLEEVKRFDY